MIPYNLIQAMLQKKMYTENKEFFLELNTIRYVIIKGEPLSVLAYNNLGKRKCADIDILVSKATLPDLEKLLNHFGFITKRHSRNDRILMLTFSHQLSPWQKPLSSIGRIIIDVNFDMFWGEYRGKRIDIDAFIDDSICLDIYGCQIKSLSPIKAMIQLILHHYREMNSIYHIVKHNVISYEKFNDVYSLWKNNSTNGKITLDALYHLCTKYEIIPYVFYILYYTSRVFHDVDLKTWSDVFWTKEGEVLLDQYGLEEKERKKWPIDFETRLNAQDLYPIIKNNLTQNDYEKIKRSEYLFEEL